MTKTFWLSFADETGHRGVCVVDVDEDDAARALLDLDARFPQHAPGAEWLAAAIRKAHVEDCNPGGQVGAQELPADAVAEMPRHRLLTDDELRRWGATRAPDAPASSADRPSR